MYLRIGGFLRPFNEANATVTYRPNYDTNRIAASVEEVWDISGRVVLQTDASQQNMNAALELLNRDFRQLRPDLEFILDDGVTPSVLRLLRSQCIEGPDLEEFQFPQRAPDVYATGVAYTARMRALKPAEGASNPILEFSETLTGEGGEQLEGYVGGAINYAERQIFRQRDLFDGEQVGSALGLYGYPAVPPPIWPGALTRAVRTSRVTPRITGPIPREFEIRWRYNYQFDRRLAGLPHQFPPG